MSLQVDPPDSNTNAKRVSHLLVPFEEYEWLIALGDSCGNITVVTLSGSFEQIMCSVCPSPTHECLGERQQRRREVLDQQCLG